MLNHKIRWYQEISNLRLQILLSSLCLLPTVYCLHHFYFDAGVVGPQNFLVSTALSSQPVSARLAHADAMSPAAPVKYKLCNSPLFIAVRLNNK